MHRVFVYGTLLRGHHNNYLLGTSRFVGEGRTLPCFTLLDLGGCPGLRMGGHSVVKGEVYEVDDQTLARLDRLEGHPDLYRRGETILADGTEVLTYFLPRHAWAAYAPIILSGSWDEHRWRGGV